MRNCEQLQACLDELRLYFHPHSKTVINMRRTACAEETWLQDVGWSTAKELKGEDTMKERMQRKTEKYSRAGRGRYNPESHYRESKALSFPFHGRDGGRGWRLAGPRAAAAETLEESERKKDRKSVTSKQSAENPRGTELEES